MDFCNIFYLFEPELIKTSEGWYLPDFYLPHAGVYLEVKGKEPNKEEIAKARAAQAKTGKPVAFLVGMPRTDRHSFYNCYVLFLSTSDERILSIHDMSERYRKTRPENDHVRVLSMFSREPKRPDVVQLSDVVREVIDDMLPRKDLEESRREIHAPINAKKLEEYIEPSREDRAVKKFFDIFS